MMTRSWIIIALFSTATLMVQCQEEEEEEIPDADEEIEDNADDEEMGEKLKLSDEHIKSLAVLMDENGDKKVSLKEMLDFGRQIRHKAGVKASKSMVEEMDQDKDGLVSLKEMLDSTFSEDETDELNETELKEEEEYRKFETQKFKLADKDGDGKLTSNEVLSLTVPESDDAMVEILAAQMIKEQDYNGDGKLNIAEFGWTNGTLDPEEEEERRPDFDHLDKDGNGLLSLHELKPYAGEAFHSELATHKMFAANDHDSDKHVTLDELMKSHDAQDYGGDEAEGLLLEWAHHYEQEL